MRVINFNPTANGFYGFVVPFTNPENKLVWRTVVKHGKQVIDFRDSTNNTDAIAWFHQQIALLEEEKK